MEEALVALESNSTDERLLEAIFRGAHTIKGNSASLGFSQVTAFAHAFEELLQRFRNRAIPVTRDRVTLLLSAVRCNPATDPSRHQGRRTIDTRASDVARPIGGRNFDHDTPACGDRFPSEQC